MSQTRRQVLQLSFVAEKGNATMRIPDPKEDLTPAEILAVMKDIIEYNVFFSSGGSFIAPKSARIVETITEEFDIVVD